MIKFKTALKRLKVLILEHKLLVLIVLIGTVLRFSGIMWGFPFIFQPDEPTLVRGATGIRFDPNPHHFDWPTLQTYLLFFVFSIYAKFSDILNGTALRGFMDSIFPLWNDRPNVFYLWGRFVSAFFGSLSIVLVYLISQKLFKSKRVSLFASLIFALSLQNIEDSHFATLDSTMTFWVLLAFYLSQKIYETGRLKYYVLAGFISGLAASTKYNGAFVCLPLFLYHVALSIRDRRPLYYFLFSRNILLAALFSILGFLVGTPYALIDFRTFIISDSPKGALWQFARQKGVGFKERYLNFALLESRIRTFSFRSITPLFTILALGGMVYIVFYRLKKGYLPLIIFALFYLLYVGQFPTFLSQYFNPLFPFMAILASYVIFELLGEKRKGVRLAVLLVVLISLGFGFYNAFKLTYVFSTEDSRLRARDYIHQNVPEGSWIALAGGDKVELEEYNPKIGYGYNVKSLSHLLGLIGPHEGDKIIRESLKNEYHINYIVVSDYGLGDIINEPFLPGCEEFSSEQWAVQSLYHVVSFPPRFYNEPYVAIYSIDKPKS